MKPHVRRLLADIRATKPVPPSHESIERKRLHMNIAQKSMATLAGVTPGTITSLVFHRPVSPEMLVYLDMVLDTTEWDSLNKTWVRIVNDGTLIRVPQRKRSGDGWGRNGGVVRGFGRPPSANHRIIPPMTLPAVAVASPEPQRVLQPA